MSTQHCGHCKQAEPNDELLITAEFLPKSDYLPALYVTLHKSHFEEGMTDGSRLETKHGHYIIN